MIEGNEHGRRRHPARQYLLVSLDRVTCAIPVERVLEIRGIAALEGRAKSSAVVGWLDIRGQRVRVLDLGRLLGLGPWRRRPDTSVLIVRDGGRRFGLLVDRVKELADLPDPEVEAGCPDGLEPTWVRGTVNRPEPVVVLDDATLLAELRGVG